MDKSYEVFLNYLENKGIKKIAIPIKGMEKKYKKYEEKEVSDQLRIISEFASKVMGYRGYKSKSLDNKTGRTVEEYKVNIKKVKREIRNIKLNSPNNDFEALILENGQEYLERAEKCIDEIYNVGFIELLTRSMHRAEICLGDTDFSNLRKHKKIEVWSFQQCCYDMVEMDGFYLLNRFKRKGVQLDYHKLCNSFCGFEQLDIKSEKYILALLSYPYGFMKCYERYREDKEECNVEVYKKKLAKAIEKDGKSLIK
jgi:hypothetical protein